MVQKIFEDKLVTDNRQTTDIFELTPIHKENFNFFFFFFFFEFGRERTNGVKFIPPCFARRRIRLFESLSFSKIRNKKRS
jgi:hypothetical protein